MNLKDYRIERLSEQNLFNLVRLYKGCFNLNVSLDFLRKKYNTRLFGASYVGYLAFPMTSDYPAAYYGVFPILCKKNDECILAAQSGDTMTHPSHQGKGLFVHLANATYDLAKNEGIKFVFGFPNKNSYPGFVKKLNWKHYGDINNYVIKTGALPFDKLAKKLPIVNWIFDKYVDFRLRKIRVSQVVSNSIEFQNNSLGYIVHDNNFFAYKTYYKNYCVDLNGAKCVLRIDGRLWLGDIDYCSKELFYKTIDSLVLLGKKLGCSSVQFSLFNGLTYDEYLKKKYVVFSTNPVGAITFQPTIKPEEFVFQALDFDTY
jgi:GNAT superfamily N-acetyltransferase